MTHIVWDWNGTLAADHEVVVDSVNAVMRTFGRNPITTDDYRAQYRRPVRLLYEHFLEIALDERDWRRISETFLDHYKGNLSSITLAAGARESLAHCAELGHTQSLLSMFRSDLLLQEVDRLRIGDWFQRIDGNDGAGDAPKGESLEQHIRALNVRPGETALIGDTEDDANAAEYVGARVVLITGTQHRDRLLATGAPVVDSITAAVAALLEK